jgi:thymidylate synthase
MKHMKVQDIRNFFINEKVNSRFVIDRSGQKVIEMIGASFIANEASIYGIPNEEYIQRELEWYDSQSTNIFDINKGGEPPAAWKYAANSAGEINSNYGYIIYSSKFHGQYECVLEELIRNPDGRRATMIYNRPSIWAEYNEDGKNDFICTNAVAYYIRNSTLHSVVQMRSNDVVFGYKNDYAWQREVMSRICLDYYSETGSHIVPGTMHWQVQNLHVYERHFHLVN